ncbi:hypothetical protein [Paenibacillus periandrae]|uniref:hypothetical protein n=1 Tax=Paenibacillus periandrae TaxID=1761741 RepID=UPI001F09BD0B|nr:hypothetical protein [Paenibacillus periandrae]
MLPHESIDQTVHMVKKLIETECPFITHTQSGEGNKGIVILYFTPRHDLPRVERVTTERPRYEKGRVYLDRTSQVCDEDNLLFALDVIESKLHQNQKRMVSGSIWFHFSGGMISDIETKSSMMFGDI